ncbi:TRAP transporter small permease [Nisaea sp.]|uniref:TRAP transporter small permease n=2 Tax=Nisaea sp. TaxID=2024842 RepID=UPI003262EFC0
MFRMIDRAAEALAIIAFTVSSAFVFLNVLNRYLILGLFRDMAKDFESLRPAYLAVRDLLSGVVVTADEVPGLLLVWVAFLGAYLAMRREGHIAFDMVLERLPRLGRRIVDGINTLLISGFLVMLGWQSVRMIRISGATEIETAEIAQGWFMLILPIAAALMLIAVIRRFLSEKEQG